VHTVRPEVVTELAEQVELLLVTVKAPALDEALERVEAAPRFAVPLLNGIEHMQTLRERLPDTTVVGASIGRIEAWLERPGVVVQPTPSVVMTVASGAPVQLLRRTGAEVRENGSAAEVLWEKLARQAPTAAATSVTQRPIGELRSDPEWRGRLRAAIEETCAVAAADSVTLSPDAEWEIIEAMPPLLTSSTARDIAAGVPSELDAITGARVRADGASASTLPCSRRCTTRHAERRCADPGALRLGARARQERPAARRAPAPRVRDRGRTAGEIFDRVVCSTDSGRIAEVAQRYGADVPFLRPSELATATSPDIEWIKHALDQLDAHYDLFAIVRATNPFRGPTCCAAGSSSCWRPRGGLDPAVELVKQHPGRCGCSRADDAALLDQSHLDVVARGPVPGAAPVYVRTARSRSRGRASCRRPARAKGGRRPY
jgi:2-dehydropantoate 2-reductase